MEKEKNELRQPAKPALFKFGDFTSAAGLKLDWKIECDALTKEDWQCIAHAAITTLPIFKTVIGVPTGGEALASALRLYRVRGRFNGHRPLIVDDVWTTGKSMREMANSIGAKDWWGFVAFARGELPYNVRCFARIMV